MTEHDPLCPDAKRVDPHYDTLGRCRCGLIAAVVARERDKCGLCGKPRGGQTHVNCLDAGPGVSSFVTIERQGGNRD